MSISENILFVLLNDLILVEDRFSFVSTYKCTWHKQFHITGSHSEM